MNEQDLTLNKNNITTSKIISDIPQYQSKKDCEERMRVFFQNESLNGGGPIEEIYIDNDITYVVVTFQAPEGTIILNEI